jgi:hypothetical protein
MHDDVGAEFERTGQHGRCKSVVDDQQRPVRMGNLGRGRDIDDLQHGIRGRLHPYHPRLRPQRPLEGALFIERREREVQAGRAFTHAMEQSESPAVQVVPGDDVVTGIEQLEQGRGRGHAGGEGESANAALEVGNALFVSVPRRVVAARIFPALMLAGTALHVGGTRENGRHDSAGGRVRPLPGVNRPGAQPQRGAALSAHW